MHYKKIIPLLGSFFLILIISFFWDYLDVPLKNTNEVVGYLTTNNFNPINNTLRYIVFIILPLSFYFVSNLFFKNFYLKKNIFFFDNTDLKKKNDLSIKDLKFIILFLFIYIFFQFLLNLELLNFSFDAFHDGDFLAPAQNYQGQNKFWSSSITIHGGSNTIYTLIGWKIHNLQTIGAYRLFLSYLIVFLKILSILLSFQFCKLSNLEKKYKIFLFFILSLILINFSSYNIPLNYSELSIRDLYVVFFLIFLIETIYLNKNSLFSNIVLVTLPFLALTLHIDIAIYLYFILIVYFIYLSIQKKLKIFLELILLKKILLIVFIIIFGFEEFFAIFKNLFIIVENIDLIHGLKFPQPFFDIGKEPHASRATKLLLLQVISGIFILNAIFNKESNFSDRQKIIFIFLYILSFIMFKNALGRSDSYHMRMSSEWPYIITIFFLIEYSLSYLQKKAVKLKFLLYLIIFFISTYPLYKKDNLNLIINFKENYKIFLNSDNNKFLNYKKITFINDVNKIVKNEKCIINFTEDNSLLFLLKKPSCTKYIFPFLSSGKKLENEYVYELKKSEANYVLYKSSDFSFDNISIIKRLKITNEFLINNYKTIYSKNNYTVLKKN